MGRTLVSITLSIGRSAWCVWIGRRSSRRSYSGCQFFRCFSAHMLWRSHRWLALKQFFLKLRVRFNCGFDLQIGLFHFLQQNVWFWSLRTLILVCRGVFLGRSSLFDGDVRFTIEFIGFQIPGVEEDWQGLFNRYLIRLRSLWQCWSITGTSRHKHGIIISQIPLLHVMDIDASQFLENFHESRVGLDQLHH